MVRRSGTTIARSRSNPSFETSARNAMLDYCRNFFASHGRAPVAAVVGGFLLILLAVGLSTHSLFTFFSIEGLVIVVGGVIGIAFMSFEAEGVHTALGVVAALVKTAV